MEMLGHDYRSVTGGPSIWLDRVHPDDRDRMRGEMAGAATHARETIELEHRVLGRDDLYRRVLLRALPVGPPDAQATRIVGSIHDVEARRQLEEQLRHGALYDEVTGLPNRRLFLERLEAAITSEREDKRAYAVAFFDLDGFKLVNDSLGHQAGDHLLAEIGERLRQRLRRSDIAARFGGDEFAILFHDIPASAVAATVADVLADVVRPVELDGRAIVVSASTGNTTSDIGYSTPDEVIRDADRAMYRAKATQTGSARLFDDTLRGEGLTLSAAPGPRD
jgi:diguanylate cyclase (GGDEF)-like protein